MNFKLLRQILIKMSKKTFQALIINCLLMGAIYANGLKAQEIKSVKFTSITVNLQNVELMDVFRTIEAETSYEFSYENKDLDRNFQFTGKFNKATVADVLLEISKQTDLKFRQVNNNIHISKKDTKDKNEQFLEVIIQGITITGKVNSDEDQSGLPGVNVMVKGTTQGTVTDVDGNYKLNVPDEESIIVFSSVGFLTRELAIENRTVIDVILTTDVTSLDEIVVVGYGTQKKVNLTGAVDVLDKEVFQNRSNATVSQILVGSAIGTSFSYGRNGYQPGAEATMDIRGMGSLNGGEPYVVIDGFPGDMNRLNPEDIESVSILKDAAASAIYGARAPYGVILITTKSGKKNKKLSASYSGSVNIITPAQLPGALDSYTFARVTNEASLNKASSGYYNEESIDRIIAYQQGDYDYISRQITNQFPDFPVDDITNWGVMPTASGGWSGHANNDHWDIFTNPQIGSTHNFSLDGGSDKTAYYFSVGYTDRPGSFTYGSDSYKRINVSAKINTEITPWWDFRYETRFARSDRHLPNASRPETQDTYNALFHIIYNFNPTHALYDSFGRETQGGKQFFEAGYNDDERMENWQIFATEIRPVKGLKINADFAYQMVDKYGLHDGQEFTQTNWLTGEQTNSWYTTQVNEYHFSDYYLSSNIYATYELSLNEKHNFMLMGGMQFENAKYRSLDATAKGLIVPEVISLSTTTGVPSLGESLSHWATQGYFGRFTYNYQEKYLFESTVRYDGTSRFQESKRWGFFPSVSAAWNVSNESFWEPIAPVISSLKFRGSYGELGNQNVPAYQDLALIPISNATLGWLPGYGQTGQNGYTNTPGLVSSGLTWETAASTNIGLNMGFLQHKLQLDFDWFERTTTNMIGPSEALPGVLGASAPRSNNAELRTRGWELGLRWKQTLTNGLGYFVDFNLYDATAVVTKYNNPTGYLGAWREGQEVGEIWGWSSHGMFKSQEEIDQHVDQSYIYGVWNTGDLKYDDINGDGEINKGENTIDDPGDQILLGNTNAHYQFGIAAGVNHMGFDFSMIWKGTAKRAKGGKSSEDYAYFGFRRAGWSHPTDDHLDYYRDQPGTKYVGLHEGEANINTDSYYTRPYLDIGSSDKNYNYNSWFLMDYSYIRLVNVQLGYTIPKSVLSKVGIRVYFSGDNLLTFDHLPKGLDPTIPEGGYRDNPGKDYRADRVYSFGLNLTY